MNPATTVTGVLASLRARAAAGPWRRVLGTDWVLLALIVLVYSQFPDRLRLFDADPLVAFVAVALTLRRLLLGRRNGDLWPLLVPTLVYALICALSLFWASDSVRATTALVRLGKDLALFVLVAAAIEGVGGLRRAAWAVVIAGILTTAAPIAQWYTGDYQNDLWGFARVELAHLSGEVEGPRATGTLSDPNYFAQSLLPIVALAFGLLWTERGVLARAAAGWAIVAAGACIVLSYSRGGLIGTVAAGGLLVAGFRPWWRSAAMLAVCALLVTPVVSRTYLARVASLERVSTLTSLPKSSSVATNEHFVDEPGFRGRVSETLSAYRMLLDHPFTGVGIGNYEFQYRQVRSGHRPRAAAGGSRSPQPAARSRCRDRPPGSHRLCPAAGHHPHARPRRPQDLAWPRRTRARPRDCRRDCLCRLPHHLALSSRRVHAPVLDSRRPGVRHRPAGASTRQRPRAARRGRTGRFRTGAVTATPAAPSPHKPTPLVTVTVRGLLWTYASLAVTRGGVLLTTIVLARLLTPTDFGVVAFAIVAIDLLSIGKDVGMGAALIQHQDESSAAFDTAFTLNLLMACVLTVVCLALAPQIATWFDEPAVGPLLRWMSLTFLLDAGGFVHLVHLRRTLAFRRKLSSDVIRTIVKVTVSVTAALAGLGAGALVAGNLAASCAASVAAWYRYRGGPGCASIATAPARCCAMVGGSPVPTPSA